MKIIRKSLLALISLLVITSCSSNQNEQPEIRFVDLQGNARAIKTRIPEANAKIMSGQTSYSNDSPNPIQQEYNLNQKSISARQENRDLFGQNQYSSNVPKFNDNNFYRGDGPKVFVENNAPSEGRNPVIEYDFNDDKSNAKKINSENQKEIKTTNNNSSLSDNLSIASSNNSTTNNDINFQESNLQNTSTATDTKQSSNISKTTSKSNKIITYSSKNTKQLNQQDSLDSQASEDENYQSEQFEGGASGSIEIIDEGQSSYAKYSKRGKFYVQVGAFFNSQSAKGKIRKTTTFRNGKVLIAYKGSKRIYRSVYGPYKTRAQAEAFKKRMNQSGIEAIIVRSK